jgi:hypothetical protein
MHGTVDHPSEVVIAKSDYESYRRTRPGFFHLLTGQLISQNILFLGISFTDPNLSHLFTIIREAFDDVPPEHFAIVRHPKKADYTTSDQFEYAKRRHTLWVDDLQNYGIRCVEVDEYEDVDALIEAVERRIGMSSIMVSGSFPESGDPKVRGQVETVAQKVGRLIAHRQLRLVSGFGLVVGSAALSGMLDELNKQETPNFEWSLNLRPFPQLYSGRVEARGLLPALSRRSGQTGRRVHLRVGSERRRFSCGWRHERVRHRARCSKIPDTYRGHGWRGCGDLAAGVSRLRPHPRQNAAKAL